MNGLLMAMTFGVGTDTLDAAFPEDSLAPLKEAQRLASEEVWSGAIDAYTDHLSKLSTRNYRDKKTYEWILLEYVESNPNQLEPLKSLVEGKLTAIGEEADAIRSWRLHQLLSRIAEKEGGAEEQKRQLMMAIKSYPKVRYAEPSKHSKLQHLYNEVALQMAESNLENAEEWFLDNFSKDERFDFVYLPVWKSFYDERDQPERYEVLITKAIVAIDGKSNASPERSDYWRFVKGNLERELKTTQPN